MDIKKNANEFIQPGVFPGNYGNEPKFDTTEYEDASMFTGVLEGPYGDGSRLKDKDPKLADKSIPLGKKKKIIVTPEGVIKVVDPLNSQEIPMLDYKAKINYILSRLAAAEASEDPKKILMDMLGLGAQDITPEMMDVTLAGLKEKLPEFKAEELIKIIEEISIITQQVEVNAKATEGIIEEANKSLALDKQFFEGLKLATKSVANEVVRSTIDTYGDILVRLSIFSQIATKCRQSFQYLDPKSGKCLFRAKAKMGIKGPPIATEESLGEMEVAAQKVVELQEFAKKNNKEIKEVESAISSALENIKKKASQVEEKQKKIHVVIKKLSDVATKKKKAFLDAYSEFRATAKGYEERFPELRTITERAEKDAAEVETLATKATGDPANTIDALAEMLSKMEAAGAQMRANVEEAKALTASEEKFEASKGKEAPAEEVVTEEAPEEAPAEQALPDVEQALNGHTHRLAAGGFDSIMSALDAIDSDEVWGDAMSALDSVNGELDALAKEGEKIDADLTKKLGHFDKLIQKAAGVEEGAESIMEEMSERMDEAEAPEVSEIPEGELVAASDNPKLEKKADATKIEMEPSEYKGRIEEMKEEVKGLSPEQIREKSKADIGSWQEKLKPYLPTMGFFTAFSTACEDFAKHTIDPVIVNIPDAELKNKIATFGKAVREELSKRVKEIAEDPDISALVRLQESEGKTEESKVPAPTSDLFTQFTNELSKLNTDTSIKLAALFKDKRIKLLLSQVVKGSKIEFSVGLERRPSKEGDVSFDEIATLMSDMGDEVVKHLNNEIASSGSDENRKKVLESIKVRMENLKKAIAKAQHDASPEVRAEVLQNLTGLITSFKQAKEKHQAQDMSYQAFVDMLEEIGQEPKAPTAAYGAIDSLFAIADEMPHKELSVQDAVDTAVDILWPEIEGIYNNYVEGFELAMDNFVDAVQSAKPVQELELATASENNPNTLDRKADSVVVAPISPNDMYSSYDLSENSLELCDHNGKKKLVINKDLKNLVTKRMNEFIKGAYQDGDLVNVDFGNSIAMGTVKAYLGEKTYKVAVDGNLFTVPEINLFKI